MNNEINNNSNNQYDPKNPNNNYNPSQDLTADKEYAEKWAKWNNMKPQEAGENIFYGVDVNDKKAVKKEYIKLKFRHYFVTLISIVVLCGLGVLAFEFYRVSVLGQHPLLAVKKRVDNGYMYQGVGYKALYCDDGTKYSYYTPYDSCTNNGKMNYDQILLQSFKEYINDKKIVDESKLVSLDINNYEFDETVTEKRTDVKTGEEVIDEYNYYLVSLSYSCSDDNNCLNLGREFINKSDVKVYLKINKENKVSNVEYFRNSGKYYENTVNDLLPKVRQYFLDNNLINNEEDLRMFNLTLKKSYGYYKYDNVYYADSYVATIDYLCYSNGNTCLNDQEYASTENMSFDIALFIDEDGNVSRIAKSLVFDL